MTGEDTSLRLQREWPLLIVIVVPVFFASFGKSMLEQTDSSLTMGLVFAVLFAVTLMAAFGVVRHAHALAELLGDPLGTLILTLSVTIIEVLMISAVMFSGSAQPTLARDTLFSAFMIVLNGLLGISLLLGGWRFKEQSFNLSGANAFLAIITPLALLGLVLPNLTDSGGDGSLSSLQAVAFIVVFPAMYLVFLLIQTVQHREQFQEPDSPTSPDSVSPAPTQNSRETSAAKLARAQVQVTEQAPATTPERQGMGRRFVLLLAYLLPVVLLSEQIAIPIEHGVEVVGAPVALGGMLVAILILTPEALGGIRASLENKLTRAINYYLGAVTASLSLTIPAVLLIGLVTGREVLLGLDPVGMLLLLVTILVTILTFLSRRTNVLHGAVHLALFITYVILIFD